MRRLAIAAMLGLASVAIDDAAAQFTATPIELPARLVAGRFYVYPVTQRGDTLTLFTDTGGGLWLASDAVARLGLATQVAGVQGKDTIRTVRLPQFRDGRGIPEPLGRDDHKLFVLRASPTQDLGAGWSGMLGQDWFFGRVWTFDYLDGKLLVHRSSATVLRDAAHTVPVVFRQNDGKAANGFARIRIAVDGDSLDLLFDTGATARVPDSVAATLGGPPGERATSFITTEVFDRWRARHPDWRVVANADALPGMAAIEVPRVSVAGFDVGPVWFTQRPDRSFHTYMAQWMDKPTDGALGGSALQYFRVTVDYPNAKAVFERP